MHEKTISIFDAIEAGADFRNEAYAAVDGCLGEMEEIEPHLLEIARQTIDQQPFPNIAWRHMRGGALGPVDLDPRADICEGAGQCYRFDPGFEREISDPDRSVKIKQICHRVRQRLGRADRDEMGAQSVGPLMGCPADQPVAAAAQ